MNFKRKLWWAQHRTDVYKYGTILSLVLIVTISIIYFTYSKFTSKNEMTAYETTVEPFIKNDYFIASYIDGEWSNEIPGKNDGYVVDKIVCDNGAVGTWDNDEWGINIRNATKKIKCSVFFIVKPVSVIEKITTLAKTDTTNFATDDPDNNIRYIGANPNNYVYFNCSDYNNQSDSTCEKWRIIGVFKKMSKNYLSKEDLVKIIRNDSLGDIAWDRNDVNDWSKASLQTTLNGEYYNGTYKTGALKNDATRNAIESVVWNLGGTASYGSGSNVLASHFYGYERGTTVYSGNAPTWTGKIGLMYPSDYGYATSGGTTTNRATCLVTTLALNGWAESSDCYNNDYLHRDHQWTLTHSSSGSINVYIVYGGGNVSYDHADKTNKSVRPAAFLKSNILLSGVGDGSSNSPYQLKVG
ncbi:MAG TPA: hypothetical protein DHU33_03895 [Firmicutes bacterium]|nr:hypothetical protein [Bacillota bacterium]